MVEILCTHVGKWKKGTCWNCSRNGRRGDNGEWWRGWIQLWRIVRIFVYVIMYPKHSNNKKKDYSLCWTPTFLLRVWSFGMCQTELFIWLALNKDSGCWVNELLWFGNVSYMLPQVIAEGTKWILHDSNGRVFWKCVPVFPGFHTVKLFLLLIFFVSSYNKSELCDSCVEY
jgi:hypothetical protein